MVEPISKHLDISHITLNFVLRFRCWPQKE
jgi:hypothetical protein